MKRYIWFILLLLVSCQGEHPSNHPGKKKMEPPSLSVIIDIPALPVKQQISGTCWAYSTTSFLESEIYRIKGFFIDLSEMYFVYNAYKQKAQNYILRQGTARFTEGGCNYDPLVDIDRLGVMPQGSYAADTLYDHHQLIEELTSHVHRFADARNQPTGVWRTQVSEILDSYMGKPADTLSYEGREYTSQTFFHYTELHKEDYINLTSFLDLPLDSYAVLEIPANWSSSRYFNISLDEYMANIDHALETGYSLAIDMDLTEPELSEMPGFAFLSSDSVITPQKRQMDFESFVTTDDHNMHLVGKVQDSSGNLYYKCKNSWGTSFGIDGHFYLTPSYVRAKSIYVMLHKEGLLETTRKKIETNSL